MRRMIRRVLLSPIIAVLCFLAIPFVLITGFGLGIVGLLTETVSKFNE